MNELTLEEIEVRRAEISDRFAAIQVELEGAQEERLAELRTEAEQLKAEETALEEREKAINEAAEARAAQIQEVINHGTESRTFKEEKSMSNMEIRNSAEYIEAYANYIKSEDDRECRALLTENVTGTVPVPEFVYEEVKTAWNRDGIMARVRKTYLKGNLKVGFEISAGDATVHTEASNTAVTEEQLVLGIVELTPVSIKKWISISDEVYDMRGEEFLRYIYDELTYQIAKKAADQLVAAIIACGTTATTTQVAVPVYTSTQVTLDLVAQAMAKLSGDAADPVIIMNKATWGAFKAAEAAGNYGYDPFEGLPVLFNNSLTAFSSATTGVPYAIVGDLGYGAIANFPAGDDITIKVDDKTLMEKDLIRILGRQYVGVGPVACDAFCVIKH